MKKHKIEVSSGEVLDKVSILEIKRKHATSKDVYENVSNEFFSLWNVYYNLMLDNGNEIQILYDQLSKVNQTLWNVENDLRKKESQLSFDDEFIQLARKVYEENDKRAKIKREINLLTKSEIIEEKIYAEWFRTHCY